MSKLLAASVLGLALCTPALARNLQDKPPGTPKEEAELSIEEAMKMLKECGKLMESAEELLSGASRGKALETEKELLDKIAKLLKEDPKENPAEAQKQVLERIQKLMKESEKSQGKSAEKMGEVIRRVKAAQGQGQGQPQQGQPQQPKPQAMKPDQPQNPADKPYDPEPQRRPHQQVPLERRPHRPLGRPARPPARGDVQREAGHRRLPGRVPAGPQGVHEKAGGREGLAARAAGRPSRNPATPGGPNPALHPRRRGYTFLMGFVALFLAAKFAVYAGFFYGISLALNLGVPLDALRRASIGPGSAPRRPWSPS